MMSFLRWWAFWISCVSRAEVTVECAVICRSSMHVAACHQGTSRPAVGQPVPTREASDRAVQPGSPRYSVPITTGHDKADSSDRAGAPTSQVHHLCFAVPYQYISSASAV